LRHLRRPSGPQTAMTRPVCPRRLSIHGHKGKQARPASFPVALPAGARESGSIVSSRSSPPFKTRTGDGPPLFPRACRGKTASNPAPSCQVFDGRPCAPPGVGPTRERKPPACLLAANALSPRNLSRRPGGDFGVPNPRNCSGHGPHSRPTQALHRKSIRPIC